MEILLLGIYCFFVWLIFIKFKLLPWTTPWKVAVAIFPVVVLAGDAAAVRRGFDRAQGRGLMLSVYTDDLFATGNDVDNRAAVAAVATDDLHLAGFALAGDRRTVDKALDKLRLHP